MGARGSRKKREKKSAFERVREDDDMETWQKMISIVMKYVPINVDTRGRFVREKDERE